MGGCNGCKQKIQHPSDVARPYEKSLTCEEERSTPRPPIEESNVLSIVKDAESTTTRAKSTPSPPIEESNVLSIVKDAESATTRAKRVDVISNITKEAVEEYQMVAKAQNWKVSQPRESESRSWTPESRQNETPNVSTRQVDMMVLDSEFIEKTGLLVETSDAVGRRHEGLLVETSDAVVRRHEGLLVKTSEAVVRSDEEQLVETSDAVARRLSTVEE